MAHIRTLKITIELENESFRQEEANTRRELSRCLSRVSDRAPVYIVSGGDGHGPICDYNGNTVGHWTVSR